MRYKTVIFDLDGTAIPNKPCGMPSEKLIEVVEKAKTTLRLCAATGRPITNAKDILATLNLTDPCVISAGTQIVDPKTDEILWECNIDQNDVQAILRICKPYPYEILVRNELMGEGAPAAQRELNDSVNVMYVMQCSVADGQKILEELNQLPNVTASGVSSWTNNGLDVHITHSEATKEHAIARLLYMLGVEKAETVGVGDGGNDVHLFKSVGLRVAMGNATDELKSQADVVCGSVDDDGLAKYIESITL